jgi:cell division protein FtsQ
MYTPFFNINSIEVTGSTRYTPEKIKEASGITLGENGFRKLNLAIDSIIGLRILDSEENIEKLPYVKSCTVSLDLPDAVSVKISERQPAAYIRYLDNYLTVDSEGFVLESSSERPEGGLKEIRGIEFTKYKLGGQLEASDIEQIVKGVEILKAVRESDNDTTLKLYDVLDWVDMVDENNVLLSLDSRIVVRFNPEDKLQYTIDFTREVFFKKINTKETGRLEFSGDQGPSFIPE